MSTKVPVSGGPEIHSRRSQRVILAIGVTVKSEGGGKLAAFEEQTQTLVVNAHGCLISLVNKVEKGQLLLMTNRATQDEQSCKVVYVGGLANGKAQIGVEFTTPAPEFWHIAFPPEDWVPLERVPATRADKKR